MRYAMLLLISFILGCSRHVAATPLDESEIDRRNPSVGHVAVYKIERDKLGGGSVKFVNAAYDPNFMVEAQFYSDEALARFTVGKGFAVVLIPEPEGKP